MSYTQLTQGERYHIQYLSRHCTVTEIAKQLNRHKSTISREIRRHRTQGQQYSAEKAQRQSRTIKQRKRQPYKLDSQLSQHIDTLIRRKLSPEQVCAYLCKHHQITLHHSTIYRYLRQDKSNGSTLALKAETYFCRPYHSWEKGLNENTNGLIRQYFPKQTDFRNISDREIRRVQDELNHRPRKTLGYETPSVLFLNLFQPLIH
ncbi:IS30 family transposase [Neisseria meningitidis]|uniref:IS30 family transposase n=1 Tax=Neisseria meningitidis TaxID=487 RepID=UPI0002A4D438|nr:IS30 family transposase [Neisseria meningitidis]ELL27262.1 helix-turn-helix domain protein [Neisseria meningitidis 77221]